MHMMVDLLDYDAPPKGLWNINDGLRDAERFVDCNLFMMNVQWTVLCVVVGCSLFDLDSLWVVGMGLICWCASS